MSFYYDETAAVPMWRSTLLDGVPHGFSTRFGGVSTLAHTSALNLGFNRGDPDETVRENIRLFADAVTGGREVRVAYMSQVHGADVVYVRGDMSEPLTCDGLVADDPSVALLARIADCTPILLADAEGGIVAAVHAGWRGTVADIAGAAVEKMCSAGAKRERIAAAVGVCIHKCCFEVGSDVRDALCDAGLPSCVSPSETAAGKFYADIAEANRLLLARAGVEKIDVAPDCSRCAPEKYFSHRATGGIRGTMGAMIAAR